MAAKTTSGRILGNPPKEGVDSYGGNEVGLRLEIIQQANALLGKDYTDTIVS